ncbi:MAG: hypothetical protein KIT25_10750 [Enhydrobacter sp.]|nr:MAG: hypothetical protein KIT25_10750 [Enhydrobacter sp.]
MAISAGSYAADGGLLAATEKTSTDHFASMVTKKDCAFFRVLRGVSICREREDGKDPYDVNYDEAHRSPSEDGTQYAPPLRAASDAPATSWDAATYAPVEPMPPPSAPITAVADAAPAEPPQAVERAAPSNKSRKAKSGRPFKRVSRGQVVPAP